jgi:hypothetical protein
MNEMREKITPADDKRTLAEAIRSAQIAAADRGDVVIDMKEADLARIEVLAQDLKPVFDEVPADDPQWDFTISKGLQPRLWIDATTHVMMGRDRRTYRFVRDTRLGRIVLAESPDLKPDSEAVTTYIAERIVERQRMMEGERLALRLGAGVDKQPASSQPTISSAGGVASRSTISDVVTTVISFAIGAVIGAGGILAVFWDKLAPLF